MAYNSHQRWVTTVDQMGREVRFAYPPLRIVSLVPSQTELLFDLGLHQQLEGVTKFCTHPSNARHKLRVIGGTKNFDFAKIKEARPDLIIGNKEENYQEGIAELAQHYPVWMSNVTDLPESLDMMRGIGAITGKSHLAESLVVAIMERFAQLLPPPMLLPAAYFIWRKPYMVAASGTFIDDMLRRAGFANVFAHLGRYPEVTPAQLAQAAPARIFLSSEPYPFKEKHLAEFQEICPTAKIQLVDGELFSWYGSRLLFSAAYFQTLRPVPDTE
jgi:ABC-type Fe3+-hydroxamate transport system substrate-binding protein